MRECRMSESTQTVSTYLPKDLEDALEEQLDYGDSKSDWVREAIERRLERECDTNDTE